MFPQLLSGHLYEDKLPVYYCIIIYIPTLPVEYVGIQTLQVGILTTPSDFSICEIPVVGPFRSPGKPGWQMSRYFGGHQVSPACPPTGTPSVGYCSLLSAPRSHAEQIDPESTVCEYVCVHVRDRS